MMKKYFGFIDETGILPHDPKQRFFGVGLLMIDDVASFYKQISKHYHKVISHIEAKRIRKLQSLPDTLSKEEAFALLKGNKRFEFKFNKILKQNVEDYLTLANLYFQFPHLHLSTLVIDTEAFNFKEKYPNAWEAYVGYSKILVEKSQVKGSQIAVIADYLQMAHQSTKYLEREMNFLPHVFNTCRVESDASLLVQMVDVLLGAVVYDFKLKAGIIGKEDPEFPKTQLVRAIRNYLKRESLAQEFSTKHLNHFNVWLYRGE